MTQPSQGLLSAGYMVGSQGVSPQKKPRQEEKSACVAVTIRTIDLSVKSSDGGEFRVHGEEVGQLLLVGVVETLIKQAASYEFTINDGTGRMKAKHYFTEKRAELDSIEPGKYVSLVAQVRTSPQLHLSVQFFSLIDSPDAISYHMIEAAHAALKTQRSGGEPLTPAAKRLVASPQASTYGDSGTPFGADVMSPPKETKSGVDTTPVQMQVEVKSVGGANIAAAILDCLKAAANEEGTALSVIAAKLAPTPLSEVKSCLANLVDEGDVYTTIDEDHFATV